MNNFTCTLVFFALLCLANSAYTLDWRRDVNSGEFSTESNPTDDEKIRKDNQRLANIQHGTWVCYQKFDFGQGVGYLWIDAATPGAGGKVELRIGSPTGTVLGTVNITRSTGSWETFKPFSVKITTPVTGVQDLYLTFVGGGGPLFNLAKFRFQQFAPDYTSPHAITEWVKREPPASVKTIAAGSFTSESHPPSSNNDVKSDAGLITWIYHGRWAGYKNFDFGTGVNFLTLQAASENAGGTIEVRLGHPTNGPPIGTVIVSSTGSWGNYQPVTADLSQTVMGVQDLYFSFSGSGGALFNIKEFHFQQLPSDPRSIGRLIAANSFDQESNPGQAPVVVGNNGIGELTGDAWVAFKKFNFGPGANLITVLAATPNKGGAIEMRTGSSSGPLVATLDVTYTGSWTHHREYTAALSSPISGVHDLFLRFVDTHRQGGNLFNVKSLIVETKAPAPATPSNEGTLVVYDAVPGLNPSPYYTYAVQKVSALNAPLKQNTTNWESPFAWFSECKTSADPHNASYYMNELAGWSHTYCNFEMGRKTPIVVKISRKTVSGAPSGPIFQANAHPAHKVQSCEVINGEVYVTMHEPALVTVDIDGQMDNRDAPRSSPAEMASSKPYASKLHGSHAVSIFANPVIADKPVIGAPGVRYIKPGDPLPAPDDPSWKTLYFGKGVHHFSRNADGSPGIWKNGDAYVLMSDKTCYIPGDAMIFGNFDGSAEPSPKHRIRVYGYGTVSGARMPHWQDAYWKLPAQAGTNYKDRGISLSSGFECRFEGITLADPANHGVAFDWGGGNSRRWMKQISWRANSDMGGIPGVVEDCFFRLQDDGPYVSGYDFRRNTLWFDCNGSPFRGSFLVRGTYGAGHQTVMEDCDVIYARANWGGEAIGAGDFWEIGTYPDGTKNTGQQVVFRNIRVTDPRPTRTLFSFHSPANVASGIAGIRFQYIEYRHPHAWGAQNGFIGTANAPIHHLYFVGVMVEGKPMEASLLTDPSLFKTAHTSDFVFRNAAPDRRPQLNQPEATGTKK
jgi:Carbohydrate binding module (family 6)